MEEGHCENTPKASGNSGDQSEQDGRLRTLSAVPRDGTNTHPIRTSRLQSPTSQEYQPNGSHGTRRFDADASIVLIGIRGTGMSTLAVMASGALGFKLVDADHHFYQATSLSRAAYKSTHGAAQYRQEELRLMRCMLDDNQSRSVIACGPGVVEETGQAWLTEYAQSHAVIYIMRDAEEIGRHLRVWDTETISRLARLSGPTHRTLSSFEFYNLSDPPSPAAEHNHPPGQQSPRSLALKRLEADFLHLIWAVTQRAEPHEAQHHLSLLSPESKAFTYALSVPISLPASLFYQLSRQDIVDDASQLLVDLREVMQNNDSFDHSVADRIARQFYLARRTLRVPIIFHIQTTGIEAQTQSSAGLERVYFAMLHHGLRLAPEYITVDLRCDDESIRNLIAMKGPTKVIGHFFDPDPGLNGWDRPRRKDMVRRAQELGCDLVRLCQEAASVEDNFLAQKFIQDIKTSKEYHIPVTAYNEGCLGRTSLFLNGVLSPVTHPLLRSLAPECASTSHITIHEAQNALYSCFILDPVYFGIYGSNVAQSLSPAMHNAAFRFYGMPHHYQIFQHETLDHIHRLIDDPKFNGASITAPFKRDIIPLVDHISPEAEAIGAINTLLPLQSEHTDSLLICNRAGPAAALYGENTDWIGIHVCIRRNLSPINAVRRRTSALILGAGGMARAAVYALIRLGVRTIFLQNRTVQNAEELANQFLSWFSQDEARALDSIGSGEARNITSPAPIDALTIRVIPSKTNPWPAEAAHPTIIVSCIPTRDIDGESSVDTSVPDSWLASPTGGVAVELSYTPLQTPLIKQIQEKSDNGWISVDGLQVLPEQGIVQFELFTGRKPPRELMRREVLRAYKERLDSRFSSPSD
ncbi:type I 3-dehydroquinase-domain-containing protein [Thelonectria olida]|uniref:Type I 3-dehydroquinase-domain-containing protein n=1 Tax=Thelonectria olida TaxID=1576542 RepID=A0A9P8WIL1_9HYPO|nr:type I 3-dehydroquinase-domain-containing protein [Thelonectria olida]